MSVKTIGEKIYAMRRSRDLTQKELGEKLGVSGQAISNWERGDREPDMDTLEALADIFNVPLSAFLDQDLNDVRKQLEAQLAPDARSDKAVNLSGVATHTTRRNASNVPSLDIDGMIRQLDSMRASAPVNSDEMEMLKLYRHISPEARAALKRFAKSWIKDGDLEQR